MKPSTTVCSTYATRSISLSCGVAAREVYEANCAAKPRLSKGLAVHTCVSAEPFCWRDMPSSGGSVALGAAFPADTSAMASGIQSDSVTAAFLRDGTATTVVL